MESTRVVIVGAGLAGLCCARRLAEADVEFLLVEAGDSVGGRVRTDVVDGYRLDRGFQVLLTAYPEARRFLDYPRLDLRAFVPGALVRFAGSFYRLADPVRRPWEGILSALQPVGSLTDKAKMGMMRQRDRDRTVEELLSGPDGETGAALAEEGFSTSIVEKFFRPFLGGIFLDRDLVTTRRMFRFVFAMFARDEAVVPATGMGAIPAQIAEGLDAARILLGRPVDGLESAAVRLEDGERIACSAIVVATDGATAARWIPEIEAPEFAAVSCFYFGTPEPPTGEPILILNGEGRGPVNNACVMSNVSREYAPAGRSLVSVSVLHEGVEEADVRAQLANWWGNAVDGWEHLETYRIPHALPRQRVGSLEPLERPVEIRPGLYVCGDHRDNASIQGAMVSGRRAADAVLAGIAAGSSSS